MHVLDPRVEGSGVFCQLAERAPLSLGRLATAVRPRCEEAAQRTELVGDRPASSLIRLAGYATATGSSELCVVSLFWRPTTKRSTSAPKIIAIVVQMSSWLMIEYHRNFQSTSASSPG